MNYALIEKYRDINVAHNWYESVIEQFKADMAAIGIKVGEVYFSGFWSQGDGACFEGRVIDWDKFLAHLGYTDPVLVDHAYNYWEFSCSQKGRYYHEYSVEFDYYTPMPDSRTDEEDFINSFGPYDPDDLRSRAWFAVLDQYSHINFAETIKDVFRDHMRSLYRKLEAEYDYLTSDEAVWEAIVANELDVETA